MIDKMIEEWNSVQQQRMRDADALFYIDSLYRQGYITKWEQDEIKDRIKKKNQFVNLNYNTWYKERYLKEKEDKKYKVVMYDMEEHGM